MSRRIFGIAVFLFSLFYSSAIAQVLEQDSLDKGFFLRKETVFRLIAHSNGFGFGMTKGHNSTVFRRRIMEAEFVTMKAPKEIKTVYPFADNSKSYVYGKVNQFYSVRGGIGYEKQLNRKPYWGGVEVRYLYHLGASIGLLKPVYLYIINYTQDPADPYYLTTERFDPEKHFYENIFGRAPFNYGLSEIKFRPGLYGKAGLNFEFGTDDERIKALEVGAICDFYPESAKIMAYNPPRNFFVSFYLSFNFGGRYNKNAPEQSKTSN
jgi:hypothetical protein